MRADPEQRAVQLAEYIVERGTIVRAAAASFGCSKATVHKDVSVRLVRVSPGLSAQVRAVLARNKAERHLRGGLPPAENTVNRSAAPLHAAGWTEQWRCCVQCPARN